MAATASWLNVVVNSALRLSREKPPGEPDLGIVVSKVLAADPSQIVTVPWSHIEAGTGLSFPIPGNYTVAVEVTTLVPAAKTFAVTFHGHLVTPAGCPPPSPNKARGVAAQVIKGKKKGFAYYYLRVI